MLGALGALIRKDERTLFNKNTDGLYIAAPKLLQEMEAEFTEELGYDIQRKLLDKWPFENTDKEWGRMKVVFQQCRLRILYTSEESHEWILYIDRECLHSMKLKRSQSDDEKSGGDDDDGKQSNDATANENNNNGIDNGINNDDENENEHKLAIVDDIQNYTFGDQIPRHLSGGRDRTAAANNNDDDDNINEELMAMDDGDLTCLGGVYQKFNFEFGDGKFHDIVSMGSTKNVGWNVLDAPSFDPLVLCNVGSILNMHTRINHSFNISLPSEIWHIILGFSVDCFRPITQMMEVDIVLRDVRRWTQNLYLSENLRQRDEKQDKRIRKFGQLFIEIGGMIDTEFIQYRKQFSLRKKFVRFMKSKINTLTTETSQIGLKLKNLKNKDEKEKNDKSNKNKNESKKKNSSKKEKTQNSKKKKKKKDKDNGGDALNEHGIKKKNKSSKSSKKKHKKRNKADHKASKSVQLSAPAPTDHNFFTSERSRQMTVL